MPIETNLLRTSGMGKSAEDLRYIELRQQLHAGHNDASVRALFELIKIEQEKIGKKLRTCEPSALTALQARYVMLDDVRKWLLDPMEGRVDTLRVTP